MTDISSSSHLKSKCIDPQNGLYAVHKSIHGASTPLHVQIKIWGEQQHVSCEFSECQANMELAWRSGLQSYQCVHLRSVSYCKTFLTSPSLREDSLKEMVKSKWFGKDKIKLCVDRQTLAKENSAPLSVLSKIGAPPSKKCISVHEPTISYYSRLGRVMVSYDTKKNSWHCPCAKTQRSCTHKYIAKWHLFQTNAELFRKVRSTERSAEEFQVTAMEESDVGENTYPPKDAPAIQGMVQYILMNKKIPSTIPNHLRLSSVDKEFPRHLIPEETLCNHCPNRMVLSDPICFTQKAKILTTSGIVRDISTYYKYCPTCGALYQYQEWSESLHNFNDHVLLDLPLCLTIRNLLQVHTAVSRIVEYLELTTGVQFPSADTVLHGYLHFEALTDHEYQYSCVTCGDHPPVVIMDLHKKASFHLSVSDLAQAPEDFNGDVDSEQFWKALTEERIARGFVSSQKNNPFSVPTKFSLLGTLDREKYTALRLCP
ncbi:uncharacterized protein LOC143711263 isoform X1 [Siphateles boraxobius]|uniref:uncharacterized protein LOC143711263 isoform X1 n=1 Tax=Siphateles boraxobius TaxID=180520 RepID=UPI004063CAFE